MDSKKLCRRIYLQNRNRLTDIEDIVMVTKGENRGGIHLGKQIYTAMYKIINKGLLYSTGNNTEYLVITYNGEESVSCDTDLVL